ncbi:hypothetical protein J2Z40_000708 [Cytobacillus eiseniae]|uniref:RNA polymerase subunit sigma n=1 Tax=Cytobacillus eiseniae TaxID=762947 RepID=A0ABS4RB82_9BACI|nr:hypothetical protein [Cytobacillus eiseniae]MBP2240155.1 hypothetical protein [Cytobacillus eiseniae]
MSLKSVEMQIALPRTFEAGKIQEQLQQRGQIANDFASEYTSKEAEQKRKTVNKQEQKGNVRLSQEQNEHDQDPNHSEKDEHQIKDSQKEKREKHPYKGNFIDFSG